MLNQIFNQRQSVGVSVITKVASDVIEAGSSRLKIKATGHLAAVGDVISITSKGHAGCEARVVSTETDYININHPTPLSVSAGDTFDILRIVYSNQVDAGMRHYTSSRVQLLSGVSTLVIAANDNRKTGSYFQNNNGATIWGNYGASAITGQGFQVFPDGLLLFNTTQAIYAIQDSGSPIYLDVFEAT